MIVRLIQTEIMTIITTIRHLLVMSGLMASSGGARWFVGIQMALHGVGYIRYLSTDSGDLPKGFALQADIAPLWIMFLILSFTGAFLVFTSPLPKRSSLLGRIVSSVGFSVAVGFASLWFGSDSHMGALVWSNMAFVMLIQATWVNYEL